MKLLGYVVVTLVAWWVFIGAISPIANAVVMIGKKLMGVLG